MNKEEILEKSRKENMALDERQQQEVQRESSISGALAVVVSIIFYMVATFLFGESGYGYLAIAFLFLASNNLLNYLKTKRRKAYLVGFIAWGIAFVIYALMFLLRW